MKQNEPEMELQLTVWWLEEMQQLFKITLCGPTRRYSLLKDMQTSGCMFTLG